MEHVRQQLLGTAGIIAAVATFGGLEVNLLLALFGALLAALLAASERIPERESALWEMYTHLPKAKEWNTFRREAERDLRLAQVTGECMLACNGFSAVLYALALR